MSPSQRFVALTVTLAAVLAGVSPARAATIDVVATRIEGDPIPNTGYRVEDTQLALRIEQPPAPPSPPEGTTTNTSPMEDPPAPRTVLRIEVEITVECRDDNGRPARCPKTSIYSLPMESFRIQRPNPVTPNNRGHVFYTGGGKNIYLGRITGLGNTEWVVLNRMHSIQATHQAVKLRVADPGPPAPPGAVPAAPRRAADVPAISSDTLDRTETPMRRP